MQPPLTQPFPDVTGSQILTMLSLCPKLPVSFCLCLSPYIFLERSYLLILQNLPPTSQSPSIHNSTCIVLIKSLFWNSASFVCLTYGAVIFSLFFLSFTSYVYTTQVSNNASETDFFFNCGVFIQ